MEQRQIKPVTAYELLQTQPSKLSSGCHIIDNVLGGFSKQGITELGGAAGCGKTQLCIQLCLTVQYPENEGGLDGGAVYICTEDAFPIKRLQQLIELFPTQYQRQNRNKDFGNNIYIEHVSDVAALKDCLTKRIRTLLKHKTIKLLIIDSIAGVFRGTYEGGDGLARTKDMREVGMLLHQMSFQYQMCVVCVNQVADVVKETVPALGLAWSNLVTTRIQLFHSGSERTMKVLFSPEHGNVCARFKIESFGVKGLQ